MDWLLSTTQAISTDVARRKSILAQEEQYCNSLREHIEEADEDKEKLNSEITTLLETVDHHRRRYAADSETRGRMQESACLYREKERQADEELMKERERRSKLQERVKTSLKKHKENIENMKSKFPSHFRSSEDDVNYLNQLRAKKIQLIKNILSLKRSVSAPENKDWALWKQHVVRLANMMLIRNQIYNRYETYDMNKDDTSDNTTGATNDNVEEASKVQPVTIFQKGSESLQEFESRIPSNIFGEKADFTLFENDEMDIELETPVKSKESDVAECKAMEIETSVSMKILDKQSDERAVANIDIDNALLTIIEDSVDEGTGSSETGKFSETGDCPQQSQQSLPYAVDHFGASELTKDSTSALKGYLPQPKECQAEKTKVDELSEVRTPEANLFSSPPTAQTGLSQKLNAFSLFPTQIGSPTFQGSMSTISKYFNQFMHSSPIQRSFGSLDVSRNTVREMDAVTSAQPIAPIQSIPAIKEPNKDSTDFERSFELLDLEQRSLFDESAIPREQNSHTDANLQGKRGSSDDPISNKIGNLENLEFPADRPDKSNSASKETKVSQTESNEDSDYITLSNASTAMEVESAREINIIKENAEAELLKQSDKPDSSEKPYSSSNRSSEGNDADITDLQSATEVFSNVPRKDERKAFLQSLFKQSPPVDYSPVFKQTPPVGTHNFSSVAKDSESEKQSAVSFNKIITESIMEKSNDVVQEENSSLSKELTDSTVIEGDALEKPLSQQFSPTVSTSSLEETSHPLLLHHAQNSTIGHPLTHSPISSGEPSFSPSVNKDSAFSFSLFETPGVGSFSKASGNVFSIFGSPGPSDSPNIGESTDSFSLFKSDDTRFDPTSAGAYNNPFSFNFGMGAPQTKSPPGVENNFFSMFSSSQTFNEEESDSQPSFKLF